MPAFADLVQQGSTHAWLFVVSAILLGALHGLGPSRSKSMMAAFIVAIRGTFAQAALLGLATAVSHTVVVWLIAFAGMYLWQGVDPESSKPYFQLGSASMIIVIALWMLRRTVQDQRRAKAAAGHGHSDRHDQDPGHAHGHDGPRRIDTGHGTVSVEVFEDGVPPRWRLRSERGHHWSSAADVSVETERSDGSRQRFTFVSKGGFLDGYLESVEEIAEPHEFMARVSLGHDNHIDDYDLAFVEGHHGHTREEPRALRIATDGYQDAHELARANDVRRKFENRNVTTGQIVLFGLAGALVPGPAAFTVLLLSLQLKDFALGFALVLCFSIGLAISLVVVGATAAIGVRRATKRWNWFATFAARAPYFSSILIIAAGIHVGSHGWSGLSSRATEVVAVTSPAVAFD